MLVPHQTGPHPFVTTSLTGLLHASVVTIVATRLNICNEMKYFINISQTKPIINLYSFIRNGSFAFSASHPLFMILVASIAILFASNKMN